MSKSEQLGQIYENLGISRETLAFGEEIERSLKERFEAIDGTAEYNQLKVIAAMQKNRISDIHFAGTTGYGYNDLGRGALERVYADVFHTEDALVRPQIVCGTHALYTALAGNLRPGDELLSPVGKPGPPPTAPGAPCSSPQTPLPVSTTRCLWSMARR